MARRGPVATATDPEKRQSCAGRPDEAQDVLSLEDVDPALDQKMHLVNNVSADEGLSVRRGRVLMLTPGLTHPTSSARPWTRLDGPPIIPSSFSSTGSGRSLSRVARESAALAHAGCRYSVDSMILLLQSIIADQAHAEFGKRGYRHALSVAVHCGMLSGAIFWGCTADLMGRKHASNATLLLCSVSCVVAGAMRSWPTLGLSVAMLGFGSGGNLVLDTTVFLEFLPGSKQWVLMMLACWWGVGHGVAGLLGWVFLVPQRWNCEDVATCSAAENRGWRYVLFGGGGLVFLLSVLRVTVIRLLETPKYQLSTGRDAELVETLRSLAFEHGRTCSLTVEELEACGPLQPQSRNKGRCLVTGAWRHLSDLFSTRVLALSTPMLWLSWTLMGLAHPLFYVFLPCVGPSRMALTETVYADMSSGST